MSTLICSFDGLHDNRVLRYCADFEAHTLHMDTQTESGEKVSVHFTGLLAHWFENVTTFVYLRQHLLLVSFSKVLQRVAGMLRYNLLLIR